MNLFFLGELCAQYTLFLKPDPECGKDAYIHDNGNPTSDHPDFNCSGWTTNGAQTVVRNAIDFNLSSIPAGATVTFAELRLYHNPTSWNGVGHSGANSAMLRRIISPWPEIGMTWLTQPSITTINQVNIAPSISVNQNLFLNITTLLQDYLNDPANSFGFMLQLVNEIPYARWIFASSDNANPALWPELYVEYDSPVPPVALAVDLGNDTTLCAGASIMLNVHLPGADSYLWSDGSTGPALQVNAPGTYSVQVTICGQVYTDDITVSIAPGPQVDLGDPVFLCNAEHYQLQNFLHQGGYTYRWSNGADASVILVSEAGTYWVDVSFCGNTVSDTIKVQGSSVTGPYFPHAFTPNNDGLNEVFRPVGFNSADIPYEFTVFNRWGEIVYISRHPSFGWNGLSDAEGSELPPGIYAYKLVYTDECGMREEYLGKVTLLR